MKKLMVFGIILFILLFVGFSSAIIVNEVELDPAGNDSGNEWIELYSETEINLTGWQLVNKDNETIELTQTFQDYLIINLDRQWLDNSDEKVILKNNSGAIIYETNILNDPHNDERSWQYCNEGWIFKISTKNAANACGDESNGNENPDDGRQTPEIYFELEWGEDEIINGEEFEIEARVFNLEDKSYEVKVYLRFKENDTIISETHHEDDDIWKSSTYYLGDVFSGPGNDSRSFSLRIKDDYENFNGDAKIGVKIRRTDTSTIITEDEENIEVLEKEESQEQIAEEVQQQDNTETTNKKETSKANGVIKLGARNKIETDKQEDETSRVLYESGSEKVKKYAIYGLNFILIIIIIFLLKKKV